MSVFKTEKTQLAVHGHLRNGGYVTCFEGTHNELFHMQTISAHTHSSLFSNTYITVFHIEKIKALSTQLLRSLQAQSTFYIDYTEQFGIHINSRDESFRPCCTQLRSLMRFNAYISLTALDVQGRIILKQMLKEVGWKGCGIVNTVHDMDQWNFVKL